MLFIFDVVLSEEESAHLLSKRCRDLLPLYKSPCFWTSRNLTVPARISLKISRDWSRGVVTMGQPCMRAYSLQLIKTCHRRGVHAMGGMAAQIPIKNDPAANDAALQKARFLIILIIVPCQAILVIIAAHIGSYGRTVQGMQECLQSIEALVRASAGEGGQGA